MLKHYTVLREQIDTKTRGRKHTVMICKAPELWASRWGDDVLVHLEGGGCVGVLKPDNSLTVQFGHWHTQLTTKIISELTGRGASLNKNHIWFGGLPTENGTMQFDAMRRYNPPEKFVDLKGKAYYRLQQVTRETTPPDVRLRLEIGEWTPRIAVTQRVKDYALGMIERDKLSPSELITCMQNADGIVNRILAEAA